MRLRLQSQQQKHRTEVEAEQKIVELKRRLMEMEKKQSGGKQRKTADITRAATTSQLATADSDDFDRLAAARGEQMKRQKKR